MNEDKQRHLEYQRQFFDEHWDVFTQPVPEEVEERTRLIVQSVKLAPGHRVIDVGTGTGVLLKHFLEAGVAQSQILGCDLSERMLEEARRRYPTAMFKQGDFVDLKDTKASWDAVFFNACFGNMFDQDRVIDVAQELLRKGGAIVISQPLGNRFIDKLKQEYPQLTLTSMPSLKQLHNWCRRHKLTLELLRDEADFYLAILRKTRAHQE